jgi:hypothetical protein
MDTRIVIDKDDLDNSPKLEAKLKSLCKEITDQVDSLILHPKDGYVVPLVILLTDNKISYSMCFPEPTGVTIGDKH